MAANPQSSIDFRGIILPQPDGSYDYTDPTGEGGGGGIIVSSASGVLTHGSTATISGSGFSSETQSALFFTEFEGGTLGNSVAADEPGVSGGEGTTQEYYRYSDDNPLSGDRVAKAHPAQTDYQNSDDLYIDVGDLDECFVEYFSRVTKQDFASSFGAPQIKQCRLSSGPLHTDIPYIGITEQDSSGNATLVWYEDESPLIKYPNSGSSDNVWNRTSMYLRLGAAGTADGERWIRTSYTNQWGNGGVDYFRTPDEWSEPDQITRWPGQESATIQNFRPPFYQRSDQESEADINHILITSSRERVMLSTSPTLTASNSFEHVSCPCVTRSNGEVTFTSMIDCLPIGSAVYLYVFNDDGTANESGYQVREAS